MAALFGLDMAVENEAPSAVGAGAVAAAVDVVGSAPRQVGGRVAPKRKTPEKRHPISARPPAVPPRAVGPKSKGPAKGTSRNSAASRWEEDSRPQAVALWGVDDGLTPDDVSWVDPFARMRLDDEEPQREPWEVAAAATVSPRLRGRELRCCVVRCAPEQGFGFRLGICSPWGRFAAIRRLTWTGLNLPKRCPERVVQISPFEPMSQLIPSPAQETPRARAISRTAVTPLRSAGSSCWEALKCVLDGYLTDRLWSSNIHWATVGGVLSLPLVRGP